MRKTGQTRPAGPERRGFRRPSTINADGTVGSFSRAERQFLEEHQARWGNLGVQSARSLLRQSGTEARFLVKVNSDLTTARALAVDVPDGLRVDVMDRQNWLVVSGNVSTILSEFSRRPSVESLFMLGSEPVRPAAPFGGIPNNAITSASQSVYFPNVTGDGVKVGLIEGASKNGKGCRIWARNTASTPPSEGHEAFRYAPEVKYDESTPLYCSSDSTCHSTCGLTSYCRDIGDPMGNVCVDGHGTWVASRLMSGVDPSMGNDQPFHAAKVELLVANAFELQGSISGGTAFINWTAPKLEDAYHWMVDDNQVRIINESWELSRTGAFDWDGFLADWYARHKGTLVVKAGGNKGTGITPIDGVSCSAYNSLCVGGFDWSFFGSGPDDFDNYVSWAGGRWQNFYGHLGPNEGLEVEKPDLAASADSNDHVANVQGDDRDGWVAIGSGFAAGTSGAAPVAAGLAALVQEDCSAKLGNLRQEYFRSLFRTLRTWRSNHRTDELTVCRDENNNVVPRPLYPNAQYCDFQSGTGPLVATFLGHSFSCEPEQGSIPRQPGAGCGGAPCATGFLTGTIDPNSDTWETSPEISEPQDETEFLDNATTRPLRIANYKVSLIKSFGDVGGGARIRSTLSYNSCPHVAKTGPGLPSSDDLAPAVNFDYGLAGIPQSGGGKEWIFVDQSFHDVNLGMDVTLPETYSDVGLYLIAPVATTQGQPNPDVLYESGQIFDPQAWKACRTASGTGPSFSERWAMWWAIGG